jgi:hypothetical protein
MQVYNTAGTKRALEIAKMTRTLGRATLRPNWVHRASKTKSHLYIHAPKGPPSHFLANETIEPRSMWPCGSGRLEIFSFVM